MHQLQPSPWVRRFTPLIPAGGSVIDIACGRGRHARFLAQMGYCVEAVDRDANAVAELQAIPRIATRVADLETDSWPYRDAQFDAAVVTNYLWRPHFASVLAMLKPQGLLIYETFMTGQEKLGNPSNPDFLLKPYELLDRVRGRLCVVAFEQGRVDQPDPAFVQRICAVAGEIASLPA